MRLIRVFHITSLSLLLFYGVLAVHRINFGSLVFWSFWLAYAGLVFGMQGERIWCLRLLVLPPLIVFLSTVPNVVYNIYAFLIGDPLYQDSPATILIVGIVAVFVTLPSGLVLAAYWRYRQEVFKARTLSNSPTTQ